MRKGEMGGKRGYLLENAVGKSDKAGAVCNDREVCTESAADPNDEDRCDAKTSVGSGTTARTAVNGRV